RAQLVRAGAHRARGVGRRPRAGRADPHRGDGPGPRRDTPRELRARQPRAPPRGPSPASPLPGFGGEARRPGAGEPIRARTDVSGRSDRPTTHDRTNLERCYRRSTMALAKPLVLTSVAPSIMRAKS